MDDTLREEGAGQGVLLSGARHPGDLDWEALHHFWGTDRGPSEGDLVKAALHACQGFPDCHYVSLNARQQRVEVAEDQHIQQWQREMLEQICQLGLHYSSLTSWIKEVVDGLDQTGQATPGSYTRQAFCEALKRELGPYIAKLGDLMVDAHGEPIPWDKGQWRSTITLFRQDHKERDMESFVRAAESRAASTSDRATSSVGRVAAAQAVEPGSVPSGHGSEASPRSPGGAGSSSGRTFPPGMVPVDLGRLRWELFPWLDIMPKLDRLANILKEKNGGEIAQTINLSTNEGAATLLPIMRRLLVSSFQPFKMSAIRWLSEGALDPSDRDFFVQRVETGGRSGDAQPELWNEAFRLSPEHVPASVLPLDLATCIYQTGKSLHFLLHACNDKEVSRELAKETVSAKLRELSSGALEKWEWHRRDMVTLREVEAAVSTKVESRLLEVMRSKFELAKQFFLLKEYVLLCRGDFAQALLVGVRRELDLAPNQVSANTLAGALESAIQLSQPSADEMRHLQHLRACLVPSSQQGGSGRTIGWNVFSLEYHLDPPLTAVVPRVCQEQYRHISRFLLTLRKSLLLSSATGSLLKEAQRREALALEEEARATKLARGTGSGRARRLWGRVLREAWGSHRSVELLLQSLQTHFMLGAIDISWCSFHQEVEAATSLEEVVVAHKRYLRRTGHQCFLGPSEAERGVRQAVDALVALTDRLNTSAGTLRRDVEATPLTSVRVLPPEEAVAMAAQDEAMDPAVQPCKGKFAELSREVLECREGLKDKLMRCRAFWRSHHAVSYSDTPTYASLEKLLLDLKSDHK